MAPQEAAGFHYNNFKDAEDRVGLDYVDDANSAWDVILNPEPGQDEAIIGRSPKTKVLARPFVKDGELHARMRKNPDNPADPNPAVSAGKWAARLCLAWRWKAPKAHAWIVLNEPPVKTVEDVMIVAQFDIAFMDEMEAQGMTAAIGAFSGGTLQLPSVDGGAAIRAYAPALRRAMGGNGKKAHYLVVHLYAPMAGLMGGVAPTGWVHDPRYFMFRWRLEIFPWCRANGIPIPQTIATEFLVDLGMAPEKGYQGNQYGWQAPAPWGYGNTPQGRAACIADMKLALAELVKDKEFEGACIYCVGNNGTATWESFMADPLVTAIGAEQFPTVGQAAPPQTPPTPPTPPVVNIIRLIIVWLSQLGKNADYALGDCIQACIAGLLRSLGHDVTVNDVARKTNLPPNYTWSELVQHGVRVAALKPWNVELMWVGRITPNILRAQLRKRKSAILLTKYNKLKKRFDPNYTQNHAITVHGFDGEYFFYDDPYWPEAQRKDGEDIKIHERDLFAAMNAIDAETPAQGLFLVSHTLPMVGATPPAPPVPVEKPSREKLLYEASVAIDRQEREGRKATAEYMRRKWFEPALTDPEAA